MLLIALGDIFKFLTSEKKLKLNFKWSLLNKKNIWRLHSLMNITLSLTLCSKNYINFFFHNMHQFLLTICILWCLFVSYCWNWRWWWPEVSCNITIPLKEGKTEHSFKVWQQNTISPCYQLSLHSNNFEFVYYSNKEKKIECSASVKHFIKRDQKCANLNPCSFHKQIKVQKILKMLQTCYLTWTHISREIQQADKVVTKY